MKTNSSQYAAEQCLAEEEALMQGMEEKSKEKSTYLNDLVIRQALIRKLTNQKPKPRAIIEELRVHNGNAIADVVALHSEAHCYEIKGCNDKIERLSVQGMYYNTAFRRITLVTTERNIDRAFKIAPPFWGIMVAYPRAEGLRFCHLRKASLNPRFDKELAAMTLWKSEMLELVEEGDFSSKPRDFLAQLIAETKRSLELSTNICDLLLNRHREIKYSR